MKKLLSAALLLALSACASASPALAKEIRIVKDLGGNARHYINRAEKYAANGDRIVIDGRCVSACVIYLHKDYGLDVCATPNAKIGFHMAAITSPMGRLRYEEDAIKFTRAIVAGLPPLLQEAFAVEKLPSRYRGADMNDLVWVKGADAQAAIGACPVKKGASR